MSRNRPSTTPMDFEWQNSNGPVDERSPFVTAVAQQSAKKRPHSVLDSPSKGSNGFHTPNRPHLRDPHGQHYFLSQQDRPLPAVPSHVSNAWEPRTPSSVIDFSSGGETPTTPARQEDSEAGTPDTQMANRMGRLMDGEGERGKTPKKGRRDSWFKSIFSSSPTPAKEDRKYYSKKAENRITKRRAKKTRELALREEYDSDGNGARNRDAQKQASTNYAARAAGFFAWVEAHPHLPAVLSFYLQLIVNSVLGCGFLYVVWLCYSGVLADVSLQKRKDEVEILHEITVCAQEYAANKCDPETRAPALRQACSNWDACMQRDPRKVATGAITARTFAMIVNSFFEEFSYKSMLFTIAIIFGGFNLSNWAFGVLRGKQHQAQPYHDPNSFYQPPPATPQRHPSGGYIDQQGFYTPFQTNTPYGTMNQQMLLQATQSMPALPSAAEERTDAQERDKERRKSPSKKSFFGW